MRLHWRLLGTCALFKAGVEGYLAQQGGKFAGKRIEFTYCAEGGSKLATTRSLKQELVIKDKVDYCLGTNYTLWRATVPLTQYAARKGIKRVGTTLSGHAHGVYAKNAFKAEFAKRQQEVL